MIDFVRDYLIVIIQILEQRGPRQPPQRVQPNWQPEQRVHNRGRGGYRGGFRGGTPHRGGMGGHYGGYHQSRQSYGGPPPPRFNYGVQALGGGARGAYHQRSSSSGNLNNIPIPPPQGVPPPQMRDIKQSDSPHPPASKRIRPE